MVDYNWLVTIGGCQLVGDNRLMEICWWQLVGGNLLVAIGWWQLVGGNWLVEIRWWQLVGGNRLVAREAGGGGRRSGYHTNKQKPHTSMWGTKLCAVQARSLDSFNYQQRGSGPAGQSFELPPTAPHRSPHQISAKELVNRLVQLAPHSLQCFELLS